MTKTVDGIEYAFRWCPPGTFTMSSPAGNPKTVEEGFWIFKKKRTVYEGGEAGRNNDETQHRVTLTCGFWMLETQVTQMMWQSEMGTNPSEYDGRVCGQPCLNGLVQFQQRK